MAEKSGDASSVAPAGYRRIPTPSMTTRMPLVMTLMVSVPLYDFPRITTGRTARWTVVGDRRLTLPRNIEPMETRTVHRCCTWSR